MHPLTHLANTCGSYDLLCNFRAGSSGYDGQTVHTSGDLSLAIGAVIVILALLAVARLRRRPAAGERPAGRLRLGWLIIGAIVIAGIVGGR